MAPFAGMKTSFCAHHKTVPEIILIPTDLTKKQINLYVYCCEVAEVELIVGSVLAQW